MTQTLSSPAPLSQERPWLAPSNTAAEMSATQFLRAFAAGQVSALEYVRAAFDRIERFDGTLRAFKLFDRERAEERARAIDARRDAAPPKAMAGVPIGVKDIFNTYDFPTGMGTSILEHYTPGNDARVVSNLRLEDGIVAGKTVTAEFGVHQPGPTVNPWDTGRTPGTSSSGSAVAVATRMVPVALASQTGGSIIRPASYCGVMGFKPSFGLIPRTGTLKTTDTLDTLGFLARTLDDLRLMFEVCRVRGHNYPVTEAALNDAGRQVRSGARWRVGVVRGPQSHVERPAVKAAFTALADRLADAGCEVFDYRLPPLYGEVHDTHETIYRRALAYYFRYEWKTHADLFSPRMREMIEGGLAIAPEAYQAGVVRQSAVRDAFDLSAATDFDVLICPSTADEAPQGFSGIDLPDHCLIWTFVGAPVIGLPLLTGTDELPVGVQMVSRRLSDYKLLDFAAFALEALR